MSAKWESVEEHSKMSHSPGLKKRSSLLSTFKDDKIEKYMKQPYKPEYTPKGIGEDFLNAVILRDFYTIKKILSETENRDKILNYQGARNGVETTALQIAAEANDFTMVKFLLENGAQPLDPKKFNSCTQEERVYCFYRALSSPAYLSMLYYKEIKDRQESGDKNTKKPVSKDVLLKACEMSYELHTAAAGMDLKSWKEKYEELSVKIKNFTIDLLNHCKTKYEVETLLIGRCKGENQSSLRNIINRLNCDREGRQFVVVEKAIKTEQKKFIVQDKCQRFLEEKWLHGQPEWMQKTGFGWSLLQAVFCIFVYGILHQLIPNNACFCKGSRLHEIFTSPKTSFLSHYFHYGFFLLLVFLYEVLVTFRIDGSDVVLVSSINYLPLLVLSIVWFCTLCLIEIAQLIILGPSSYFRSYWNILDMIILLSFFVSVVIINPAIIGTSRLNPFVYVACSKLTSLTFVCGLLRFMEPLYLSSYIGPTLMIFTDMRHDVLRFLVIFAYVVFAYAVAMYYFFVDVDEAQSKFARFSSSVKILITAIFGSDGAGELEIDETAFINNSSNIQQRRFGAMTSTYYTAMGYSLYTFFGLLVLIMLLNLCIAMLSDRYTRLQASESIEMPPVQDDYQNVDLLAKEELMTYNEDTAIFNLSYDQLLILILHRYIVTKNKMKLGKGRRYSS